MTTSPKPLHAKELRVLRNKKSQEERATNRAIVKAMAAIPYDAAEEAKAKKAEAKAKQIAAEIAAQQAKDEADANRLPLMSDGMYLKDAPAGKGLLITGGYDSNQIDMCFGAAMREHDGEIPWDGEGASRRHVSPEGSGRANGGSREDSADEVSTHRVGNRNVYMAINKGEFGDKYKDGDENTPVPKATRTFRVKLGGDDEKSHVLRNLIGRLDDGILQSAVFKSVGANFRCICGYENTWFSGARRHFSDAVDSELEEYARATAKARSDSEAWEEFLESNPSPHVMPISPTPAKHGAHAAKYLAERKASRKATSSSIRKQRGNPLPSTVPKGGHRHDSAPTAKAEKPERHLAHAT